VTELTGAAADRLRAARLTYPEIGSTARALPSGYRHVNRTERLGSGPDAFTEAAAALMSWQAHLRAGLRVSVAGRTAAVGVNVLLHVRIGPLRVTAPCRVVYVVDEPSRRGFAYGTLDGHPESGEEAFTISLTGDGAVIFAVTAFSRPATWLARAAGPIGRYAQDMLTGRYLKSLATSSEGPS
jgi:uncharacterized protein (UPF0548 family)